jgi:hypothetical protein
MLKFGLRPPLLEDLRDRFVIAPHHADRLRRPAARPGAAEAARFQHALTWNVFRTLELLAPSYWLRRLHVRLTGEPSLVAPQIVGVQLWRTLPLPPIQRIDGGRPDVLADVVIETEHAVWTLIVSPGSDPGHDDRRAAELVDAGAWLAGARAHHCGAIEMDVTNASLGSVLKSRYARSRESTTLRSATRGPAAPTAVTWGVVHWADIAALLQECRDAHNLPVIERTLARNALDWLTAVGTGPAWS